MGGRGASLNVNHTGKFAKRNSHSGFGWKLCGHLRGVLTRDAMIKALKGRGPDTPVLEVMQANVPTMRARAKLETALRRLMQKEQPVVGVTDADGRLVGLLTVENLGELMMVHSALPKI